MTSSSELFDDLRKGLKTPQASLLSIFDLWLSDLRQSGIWCSENIEGRMVPWQSFSEAKRLMPLKATLERQGLYLFASNEHGLVYVGMTNGTLGKRLRGRYFGGSRSDFPKSQFRIAQTYKEEILRSGLSGIPRHVTESHLKHHTDLRLRHAVELVRRGIDQIWFSAVPFGDTDNQLPIYEVDAIESNLIDLANQWNRIRGYIPLLNQKKVGTSEWLKLMQSQISSQYPNNEGS